MIKYINYDDAINAVINVPDGNWSQKRYVNELKKLPTVSLESEKDTITKEEAVKCLADILSDSDCKELIERFTEKIQALPSA